MHRIRLWQWPNLLALDAALIALAWQAAFAQILELQIHASAQIVLGLSVWLTYMADRLFDVARRPYEQLHSVRHRFAKQFFRHLWGIWCGILITNIAIAFIGLSLIELRNGALLLALCLLYTVLNQTLSKNFFPKELCVALIYTGGVIVFLLPTAEAWAPAGSFALLCLINCLIIGIKERAIDALLQVHSLALLPSALIVAIESACVISLVILGEPWSLPIGLSLAALLIIHRYQNRLSIEAFRVLTDSALLIGPIIALIAP